MSDLFSEINSEPIKLPLSGAEAIYYPNFIAADEAESIFKELLEQTPWQQDDIKVFGKVYQQPRLTALYAENDQPYSYSNITMHPKPFTPLLLKLKDRLKTVSSVDFTTVLLNLYRDGNDSNGWHADDEKELGENPVIASLSFGASRNFRFREKANKKNTYSLTLDSGSLLLMQGATQHLWQHQIPKTKKEVGPRINLTFRVLI
ncbi:alpha-ketoglutarate-dependent dioxygenase AlkB family protein [Gilvibacter sediminis]|uniref:alpha-ketoglutarate-dependent dioxygenase AlkB family protein n=1 Tax=Gilvibacter sediminis TaxID=379071 RepID=UPI0023500F85|nr:alpha-ketoglutarate-dependent dioxygenase AlkB [Gilvibacter sediminis]MDC7998794.1 alpha-ketoglutarate-dependent dioxygenase AlkB [Gilvibacter sediminis]